MTKHKVADLEGALLDRAVGIAAGEFGPNIRRPVPKAYTSDWAAGGPIIEREEYCLPQRNRDAATWHLGKFVAETPAGFRHYGPHPLIAAMRAFVASKFGDEVALP